MSFQSLVILLLCTEMVISYRQYYLDDLCTNNFIKNFLKEVIFDEETIKYLEPEGSDSAGLINMSWNSSTFKRQKDCTFKFSVPSPYGIYATIRKLNLRKTLQGDCHDYIQFKNMQKIHSKKICGKYELLNSRNDQNGFVGENPGIISVSVSLDRYAPLERTEDQLDVSIIFVAYEKCTVPSASQMMCTPGRCVSKALKNSGLIHCSTSICLDDETCITKPKMEATLNSSNIALSAITSLIFTMFVVGLCMWICWKYSTCRSSATPPNQQPPSSRCSGGRTTSTPYNNRSAIIISTAGNNVHEVEYNPVLISGRSVNGPNLAHAIEYDANHDNIEIRHEISLNADDIELRHSRGSAIVSNIQSDDKDLPPSYESLFPEKPPEDHHQPTTTTNTSTHSTP